MKSPHLALLLLTAVLAPAAFAQDMDELYRRMQAGDEAARREYWARKKGTMREIFEQAYQGTLQETRETAPPSSSGGSEPPPGETTGPTGPSAAELANALKLAVVALFNAYEQESIGAFLELVHASFAARDRNGTDYRQSDLPRVLSDDFAILERIGFSVQVEQPVVQSDGKRAQVEVVWSRRAWVQTGGQEWILLDQRSVLQLEADATGRFLLAAIYGDPIFAIARPKGEIIVTEGTIDGVTVTTPITLDREEGIVVEETPATETPASTAPPASPPSATVVRRIETFTATRLDFDAQLSSGNCTPLGTSDVHWSCQGLNEIGVENGAQILSIKTLFPGGIETVTEAPEPPYTTDSIDLTGTPSDVGELYAIRTSDGRFALLEIVSVDPGEISTYQVAYKVQTNGTRLFLP